MLSVWGYAGFEMLALSACIDSNDGGETAALVALVSTWGGSTVLVTNFAHLSSRRLLEGWCGSSTPLGWQLASSTSPPPSGRRVNSAKLQESTLFRLASLSLSWGDPTTLTLTPALPLLPDRSKRALTLPRLMVRTI